MDRGQPTLLFKILTLKFAWTLKTRTRNTGSFFCLFTLAARRSRRTQNLPPIELPTVIEIPTVEFPPHLPPSPTPSSQLSTTESESESSFELYMSSMSESQSNTTMSNTAQVKYHDGNKAPPTMLPGRVTPALLLQWEEH